MQKKFGTYPNRFWSMSQKPRSHSNVDTDLVEKLASKAQGASGMHCRYKKSWITNNNYFFQVFEPCVNLVFCNSVTV
jgi:hypothetical protein